MPPDNRVKFIQSATELADHWKIQSVALALSVPYVQVLGHLHLLWWFTSNATPESQETGDLSRFDVATLERRMHWTGEAGALHNELIVAGWLDQDNELLTVHDWEEHSGKGVLQMKNSRNRAKAFRTARKAPTSVDVVQPEVVPLDNDDPGPTACVRVLREVLAIGNPDAAARRAIAIAIPDPTAADLVALRDAAEQWKLRGYNPKNIAGVLEWFAGGVPLSRGSDRKHGARPTAAATMRLLGAAFTGGTTDGHTAAGAGRSRFSELLASSVSAQSGARTGPSVAVTGLLESGRDPAVDNS